MSSWTTSQKPWQSGVICSYEQSEIRPAPATRILEKKMPVGLDGWDNSRWAMPSYFSAGGSSRSGVERPEDSGPLSEIFAFLLAFRTIYGMGPPMKRNHNLRSVPGRPSSIPSESARDPPSSSPARSDLMPRPSRSPVNTRRATISWPISTSCNRAVASAEADSSPNRAAGLAEAEVGRTWICAGHKS